MSAAYCIFVQHHWFPPAPGVGEQLGSGCHIDLQESPDRVHAVKHTQGESEVHDHKPGGVAVKRPFHSILEDGVSPKCGHNPQLERCEGKKHKSEDDKLSSTCTLISALAQAVVGIFQEHHSSLLTREEKENPPVTLLTPRCN